MNPPATPTLFSPSSPDQANSLLGTDLQLIQDQNSSHLDHHLKTHSPPYHQDDIANHDNDSKSSVTKTEYKSNFTPFDQYVYNEITDSFVKQSNCRNTVASNLLIESRRPLSSSSSNQDLAAHPEAHATSVVSPALEASSFEPIGTSEAGNNLNSTNEPWYMEVTKRNKKANEYRLKSELGHSSTLMVEPYDIQKSPLGNDPLIEAQIQDKQQQLQSGYKHIPHEYKRDHLIAHMANNNNFKLPKEDSPNSHSSRRVVINSSSASRPLSRTTAASRARSQSSKRPSTSVPFKSDTLTKSNQTTPTRSVPSRASTSTAKANPKPMISSSRKPVTSINGANRTTTATTVRSATSSTASSRVLSSKLATTPKSTKLTPVESSPKSSDSKTHDSNAARRVARTPAPSLASKSPVKRTLNTSSTSSRATSSARPLNSRTATTPIKPSKQVYGALPTGAVKSIKTKALVNAGQNVSTNVTSSSKDGDADPKLIGLRPGSDFIQAPQTGSTHDIVNKDTSDEVAVEGEGYQSRETDLIFSTTKAGNMLADEIAQAEMAAHNETVLRKKPEVDNEIIIPSGDSTDQTKLEPSHELSTPETIPKQLVNGLEEGLVSAEDRYESSDRDAYLEFRNHFNGQPSEQHDQSDEHEPYSIIPTTYANENKVVLPPNDEFVVDRDRPDPGEDLINSSPSQDDVKPQHGGLDLFVEPINETKDNAHQPIQDIEQKPDIEIITEGQSNEKEKAPMQSDDSSHILLHSSDSETDGVSSEDLHAGQIFSGSRSAHSEEIYQSTLKDVPEEPSPNNNLVLDESNASSGEHVLPETKVEKTDADSHSELDGDRISRTELHLDSFNKMKELETNINIAESDTFKDDQEAKTEKNSEVDDHMENKIASNEIGIEADSDVEVDRQKDSHDDSRGKLSLMYEQPVDIHSLLKNDHEDHEDYSRGDKNRDDEIYVDKNELLMDVAGLEIMETMRRREMSEKSVLAQELSGSSTFLAGQPPSELVLSVDQLGEYYAHASPPQANEVDSAQQVEEKNRDSDEINDLGNDQQHVDQSSDLGALKSNPSGSEETNEALVQLTVDSGEKSTVNSSKEPTVDSSKESEVDSSKESTVDLLNFGSTTPTNDDQLISNSDVAESHHNTSRFQDDEVDSKTYDTFEVKRQSSSEDSHRSAPGKESLSDSGEDIRVDQPKHSDTMANLESDSNQGTKSITSATEDEIDEDEHLKLSNHLTNSDDDVILEPRNRKDSLSGAFSPHRSTSPSRYNEGAGLGIMVQDDEELGAVKLSDGSSAQIVAPTVAENRAEISTSKSLMSEIPQALLLLHTHKLIQDNVFDEDDEGYDLNPLADPLDVAATMSPSSSVAEEMLRLSRQASLANVISDMSEISTRKSEEEQEVQQESASKNDEIDIQDSQKNLDQSIEKSRSSSSATLSSPSHNLDSKNEGTASIDAKSDDGFNSDRTADPLNNNEANNFDTRKQSIDINSDRNNTVEQFEADKQVRLQSPDRPSATDVAIQEEQSKDVDIGMLATS